MGYCDRCGFRVEQSYSDTFKWFDDICKGFRYAKGKYIEKNDKRVRRKLMKELESKCRQ